MTAGEREAKVATTRPRWRGAVRRAYPVHGRVERRPLTARPAASAAERRARAGRLVAEVAAVPEAPVTPPWGAALEVRMPETAGCRTMVLADVTAHNTGRLEWAPPGGGWPQLHLSHHLLSAAGAPVRWDGERIPVPRVVAPGERARFLFTFRAPAEPGSSSGVGPRQRGECWFAECGGRSARVPLRVVRSLTTGPGRWGRGVAMGARRVELE